MDICFDYENRYLETHPGVYYEGVMDTLKELALEYPHFYCKQLPVRIY